MLASCHRALSTAARRLPRLPVPRLDDTLPKYTRSLLPFIEDDCERLGRDYATEVNRHLRLANAFRDGIGSTLQERLIELDRQSPFNWLDDNFWLAKAYLEVRLPLPIHSNWWLLYKDDASTPHSPDGSLHENHPGSWQVARAAWLTWRSLLFREKLEKEEIYAESTRTGSWVRPNARKFFNMQRVARPGCDVLSRIPLEDIRDHDSARSVLVLVDDWVYAVEVYSPSGSIVPVGEIHARLRAVAADSAARKMRGEEPLPVAILTSDDRDAWAKNRSHLLGLSTRNGVTLEMVEKAVFAVALDGYVFPASKPRSHFLDPTVDAHLCNIKIGRDGANRWFDKCFNLVVEADGRAGMVGEHAVCDALVPSMIADWTLESSVDRAALGDPLPAREGWMRLDWDADDAVRREIARVSAQTRALAEDSDNTMLCFADYGTDWIKDHLDLSPDAYVQMAMQLAWFKDQHGFTATYETALVRFFLHGRTETIRTLSSESRRFVKAMIDPACSPQERFAKLKEAVAAHSLYSRAALQGKGVDRHLLGLRLLLRDGERASLFEDELFARSQEWRLSTSGLTPGERFVGTGFGSPYHDGYGIPYLSAPHQLRFGIESKASCPATSTERFKLHLVDSLREMRAMCEAAQGAARL